MGRGVQATHASATLTCIPRRSYALSTLHLVWHLTRATPSPPHPPQPPQTRTFQTFPIYYIIFMFIILPGTLFGMSSLYAGSPAFQALGIMATIILGLVFFRIAFWFFKQDGFSKLSTYFEKRQKMATFRKTLEKTINDLEERVVLLEDQAGGGAKTQV